MTSATGQQLLRQLLTEGSADRPLVDIGASTASGLRHRHPHASHGNPGPALAHAVHRTRALDAEQARAIGSDTVRAGWTFRASALDSEGSFTDTVGIRWVCSQGEPTALDHPLALADIRGIRRHPRPQWRSPSAPAPHGTAGTDAGDSDPDGATQIPASTTGQVVVVEPPCPGLFELAMVMRGPWRFMRDVSNGWRAAGALLDWSLETLLDAYTRTLAALPRPPDLVVCPDTLGFGAGMYLPVHDFRTQYQPRLQLLLNRVRDLTGAPVLLQCRGSVGPVLAHLALLEPDLLHLDRDIAGIGLCRVRATVPPRTGLHGVVDLVRLGRALTAGDHGGAAREAVLLAHAWPAVAAPLRIVPADVPDEVLARAASFIRSLTPATLRALRDEPEPVRMLAPLFCRTGGHDGRPVRVELDGDQNPALALP